MVVSDQIEMPFGAIDKHNEYSKVAMYLINKRINHLIASGITPDQVVLHTRQDLVSLNCAFWFTGMEGFLFSVYFMRAQERGVLFKPLQALPLLEKS